MNASQDIILLFDIDGTLTKPRNKIESSVSQNILKLQPYYAIGLVSGGDLVKIYEQVSEEFAKQVDYCFAENGLVALKKGVEFHRKSFALELGEEKLQDFINFTLKQLSQIVLPYKRGTFLEYRNGLINISPIGRNCTQQEREDFELYDLQHKVRENLIRTLKEEFKDFNLNYAIGGQISFDVFPNGWDKSYCLQFVEKDFKEIYFFGDKVREGGNDYEIYNDPRTKSFEVKNVNDTMNLLNNMFFSKISL